MLNKKNSSKERLRPITVLTSLVVSFIIFYLLMLPAMSMDKSIDQISKVYESEQVEIEVLFPQNSIIPEDSELIVNEIDSQKVLELYPLEDLQLKSITDMKFYNIYFEKDEVMIDTDGIESLQINITYKTNLSEEEVDTLYKHIAILKFIENHEPEAINFNIVKDKFLEDKVVLEINTKELGTLGVFLLDSSDGEEQTTAQSNELIEKEQELDSNDSNKEDNEVISDQNTEDNNEHQMDNSEDIDEKYDISNNQAEVNKQEISMTNSIDSMTSPPENNELDEKITQIMSSLNLPNIDYKTFYYGNVAKDTRAGFSDPETFMQKLRDVYSSEGEQGVKNIITRYYYDLFDPNYASKGNAKYQFSSDGVLGTYYNYGDDGLAWPKDSLSPFHNTTKTEGVGSLDYSMLEDGVNYKDFFTGLDKTATAKLPGDANNERQYTIDIETEAAAATLTPLVMVFQIQTSWQMFNLLHANALDGEGNTDVGSSSINSSMANLYDIKNALIRFAEYTKAYNDTSVAYAITNVQHGGSYNMFISNGSTTSYLSNNMDSVISGLYGWDTFGDCEHVHYSTKALETALKSLNNDLSGWTDSDGNPIDINEVRKVAIIIGGPTENTNGDNGYGSVLPWRTLNTTVDSVYGIRVNEGISLADGFSGVSWLDQAENKDNFAEYYIAPSEEQIYQSLVDIFHDQQNRSIDDKSLYVSDVILEDTITDEFDLIEGTVKLYIDDVEQPLNKDNLTIHKNDDGTTYISYIIPKVYNGSKVRLSFDLQAKENYIGSNNVYTNVGTPSLSYIGGKESPERYTIKSGDTPQVNVPIRFEVENGESLVVKINSGEIDLDTLSASIVQDIEERATNFDQINGTVTYNWIDRSGNQALSCEVTISNGIIVVGDFNRHHIFEPNVEGDYPFTLQITFTPNSSFPNSGEPVNSRTENGEVFIKVVDDNSSSKLLIKKVWSDGEEIHNKDSITVTLYADGHVVEDYENIELNSSNNWARTIEGLPYLNQNGEFIEYTIKEINYPDGYWPTYSSQFTQEIETQYRKDRANITFNVLIGENIDKKKQISFTIKGTDNQEYQYIIDAPRDSNYKKGDTITFVLEGLPIITSEGNPITYDCSEIRVDNDNKTDKHLVTSSYKNEDIIETPNEIVTLIPTLVVKNSPSFVLPETGGSGVIKFILIGGGLILISTSSYVTYHLRRNK